jgi:hypothetical protein
MPLDSEIGQVKRELRRRHPNAPIRALYRDGAALDDADAVSDWKTRTGSRFQVTVAVEIELREEEGQGLKSDEEKSLDLEPEDSISDETNGQNDIISPEQPKESNPEEEPSSMKHVRMTIVCRTFLRSHQLIHKRSTKHRN